MIGRAVEGADIERATTALRNARRVLMTGGAGDADTAALAGDLAEAVGGAVDFGGLETAQASGPTIVRIGEVTADPEELRDRADLVVLWFCDPPTDFLHRFVTPATRTGRPRHTIAVGEVGVATAVAAGGHLQVAATDAVDLARLLHAIATSRAVRPPPALVAASAALVAAFDASACAAFVTHHRDPVGLEPWSLVGLVRAVAHRKPAFEVPLVPADAAAAVSTWRYGAAGGIARADRDGAEFRPAECDAARLTSRGEVDCVVAVGELPGPVEAALAARGDAVAVIRIPDDAAGRARLAAILAAVRGSAGGPT